VPLANPRDCDGDQRSPEQPIEVQGLFHRVAGSQETPCDFLRKIKGNAPCDAFYSVDCNQMQSARGILTRAMGTGPPPGRRFNGTLPRSDCRRLSGGFIPAQDAIPGFLRRLCEPRVDLNQSTHDQSSYIFMLQCCNAATRGGSNVSPAQWTKKLVTCRPYFAMVSRLDEKRLCIGTEVLWRGGSRAHGQRCRRICF